MKRPRKQAASAIVMPMINNGRAARAVKTRGRMSHRMIALRTSGNRATSQMEDSAADDGGNVPVLPRK